MQHKRVSLLLCVLEQLEVSVHNGWHCACVRTLSSVVYVTVWYVYGTHILVLRNASIVVIISILK